MSIGTALSCFDSPPCKFSLTDAPILHQAGSLDPPEIRYGRKKLPLDSCSTLVGNTSSERPRCQSGPHCPVSILLHANSQPLTPQSYAKQVPSIPRIVGKDRRSCHLVVQLLSRKHQFGTATVSIGTPLSCFKTRPCKFSTTDAPILHQTGSVVPPESR